MIKAVMKSAVTAACLTVIASPPAARAQNAGVTRVITNGPQVSPGDTSPSASARQNVIESKQYEGCSKQTVRSARRGCERSAVQSAIRNSIKAASQASANKQNRGGNELDLG